MTTEIEMEEAEDRECVYSTIEKFQNSLATSSYSCADNL